MNHEISAHVDTDMNTDLGMAIWLSQNTELTPRQISSLCPTVHELKAMLIKSGTCTLTVEPLDPIREGLITQEQIDLEETELKNPYEVRSNPAVKRYIPKILRHYVPGVILWLKKSYPHLAPKLIANSLGTTPKRVIDIINANDIQPINPISVQVLTEAALNDLIR